MARPSMTTFEGPSLLAERIREHLARTGQTGHQLQVAMHDAVPSYKNSPARISKYITQGRPVPTEDFLRAISKVLELPLEEVIFLSNRPANASAPHRGAAIAQELRSRRFTLLLGHTIWSAPIVLAAMEGMLPQFDVATYLGENHEPDFIKSEAWIPTNCDESAPPPRTPVPNALRPFRKGADAPRNAPALETLSAATAYKRLTATGSTVDAIVVPGRLAEEQGLKRLGCIADTPVSCLWLAPPQAWKDLEKYSSKFIERDNRKIIPELSSEWLAQYLLLGKSSTKARRRYVVLDSDTAAMAVLQAGFEAANQGQGRSATGYYSNLETDRLLSMSFSDIVASASARPKFDESEECAGLITWSPQAHWVESRSQDLKVCGLTSPRDVRDRHLTFEVCVAPSKSGEATDPALLLAISQLIEAVAPLCQDLNRQRTGQATSADYVLRVRESHLAKLGNYFSLSSFEDRKEIPEEYAGVEDLEEVRKALAPVEFNSMWRGEEVSSLLNRRG